MEKITITNRKSPFPVGLAFVPVDIFSAFLSMYLAFFLRLLLNPVFPIQLGSKELPSLFFPQYLVALIWLLVFQQLQMYRSPRMIGAFHLFKSMVKGNSGVLVALLVLTFIFKYGEYSRSLMFILWAVSIPVFTLSRLLLIRTVLYLKGKGIGVERIAILGADKEALSLAEKIEKNRKAGFHFAGFILPSRHEPVPDLEGLKVLGTTEELPAIINEHSLDRLISTNGNPMNKRAFFDLLDCCERMDVSFDFVPDFVNFVSNRVRLGEIDGLPLISIKNPGLKGWQRFSKRAAELTMVASSMLFLIPLFMVLALLIRLESPGPIFFRQERTGKGGRHFRIFKFRSMYADAEVRRKELEAINEKSGYLFKIKNDPRITRVGKFMRRFSLDELPQIINVLKGEMSLIGPRPLPAQDLKNLSRGRFGRWFEQRIKVHPGITGLWQVMGRSDTDFEDMVKYDIYYEENWSLWLDLQILAKTLLIVLKGSGAY